MEEKSFDYARDDATRFVDELKDRVHELYDENKRLNNIINELEKWLNEWKSWIDRPDEFEDGIISCINDTLDKLQELKGSDKE